MKVNREKYYSPFINRIARSLNLFSKSDRLVSVVQKIYHSLNDFPKTVQLHTVTSCNLRCVYCYSDSPNTKESDISWGKLIAEAAKLRVSKIHFLGGEPFTDKNLEDYLQLCDRYGIKTRIYTNGFLIDSARIAFLQSLKHSPTIVLKLDHPDTYNELTAPGKFQELMDVIEKLKSEKFNMICHVVINRKNYNMAEEIVDICDQYDLPLEFERYTQIGNSQVDQELTLNAKQWNQALAALNRNSLSHHKVTRAMIRGNSCSCYIDLFSITNDGFVLPCPLAPRNLNIGNIKENSLKKIWARYKKKRKEWLKIPAECSKCSKKLLCHGGCKTDVFKRSGDCSLRDPLCDKSHLPTCGGL